MLKIFILWSIDFDYEGVFRVIGMLIECGLGESVICFIVFICILIVKFCLVEIYFD